MFETPKTLIVVYRDEMLVNQLKKMVETPDNSERGVVETKNDSIDIVSWTERVWLEEKKKGNIKGKVLFLGDIKGTDKLIPVIDTKFDEYGIKFGWAGNQAVVYVEPKALTDRKDYDAFLERLSVLPVPEFLKAQKGDTSDMGAEHEENESSDTPEEYVTAIADDEYGLIPKLDNEKHKKPKVFCAVQKAFSSGANAIGKAGNQIAVKSEEVFRNRALMKIQMLFYGVVKLYDDGLEEFMKQ